MQAYKREDAFGGAAPFWPPECSLIAKLTGGLRNLYLNITMSNVSAGDDLYEKKKIGGGRYLVGDELYATENCTVVAAKDLFRSYTDGGPTMDVAIKILAPHASAFGYEESDILVRIRHDSIVRLLTTFECDGRFALVFPLLHPDPVTRHLQRIRSNDDVASAVWSVGRRISSALAFLARRRIVHADVKPANILLATDASFDSATLVDFGNAMRVDEPADDDVQPLSYRAPEILAAAASVITSAADTWSLGCVLAELCLEFPLVTATNKSDAIAQIRDWLGSPTEGGRSRLANRLTNQLTDSFLCDSIVGTLALEPGERRLFESDQ